MLRPGAGLPLPRLTVRDAAAEAIAGIVQRPGRAGLTMLGTVLGVGAFVAVLGLTATGAGQISRQFTVLEDTTVTVADNGPPNNVAPPGTNPGIGFPVGADAIADHINGVSAAGVWWPVALLEASVPRWRCRVRRPRRSTCWPPHPGRCGRWFRRWSRARH